MTLLSFARRTVVVRFDLLMHMAKQSLHIIQYREFGNRWKEDSLDITNKIKSCDLEFKSSKYIKGFIAVILSKVIDT